MKKSLLSMSLPTIPLPAIPAAVTSFFCGALMVLAFAPFNAWFLILLLPAYLSWAWLKDSPREAFKRGWWFGVGFFAFGLYWVYYSLHVFGHAPLLLAIGLTVLLVFYLAIFIAAVGWVQQRWFSTSSALVRLTLVTPSLWILFEWLRGTLLTGLSWLSLGYGLIDSPLAGMATVVGVYGLSFVGLCATGLVVVAITEKNRQRYISIAGLAALIFIAFMVGRVHWSEAVGEKISVALVQGNTDQKTKWHLEQRRSILQSYLDASENYWSQDLIIWPETAMPAYAYQLEDSLFEQLQEKAMRTNTDLLTGVLSYDFESQQVFNSMRLFAANSAAGQAVYHKRHLVPFGEYMPFRTLLLFLKQFIQIPMSDMSPGERQQPLLVVGGYPVAVSICFEDVFGEELIDFLPQANFLVNASNDAWFGDTLAPHQHLEIARMRALETGRYMLRATSTGITAIIDDKGRIVSRAPQFEQAVLTGQIPPLAGATPYVRWGNGAILGLALLLLIIVLIRGSLGFFRRPF
ncbi:MAG: apolipoprotein N-acyltransferase [Gammaproteobacteria bacterium]|nr:apolipoprotein N-acyltransferase [Gammaproteobacteria bacterium]